jgi:hypothetical protein
MGRPDDVQRAARPNSPSRWPPTKESCQWQLGGNATRRRGGEGGGQLEEEVETYICCAVQTSKS